MNQTNETENYRHESWAGYSSVSEREGFQVVHTFPDGVRITGMREIAGRLYVTTSEGAYVYDGDAMKKIETPSRITPLHVMDYDRTWLVDRELSGVNQDMVLIRHDEARASVEELANSARRVTAAFRGLGTANGVMATIETRRECERAMVALDAALAAFETQP